MGKCEGGSNYSIPRTLANIPPEPPATAILTMVIFESVFSTFGIGEIKSTVDERRSDECL